MSEPREVRRWAPGRRATAVVPGPPEDVLYRSVHALRRMGARITRWDIDGGTLEARTFEWGIHTVIRVAAAPVSEASEARTRLTIESDASSRRRLVRAGFTALAIRRFRAELARTSLA